MNERKVPDYVEKALFEWSDGALTENARDAAILRFVNEAVAEATVNILNDYQRANLRSAIEAAGFPYRESEGAYRGPLSALNTGDWLGELYWLFKLDECEARPNATMQELRDEAAIRARSQP